MLKYQIVMPRYWIAFFLVFTVLLTASMPGMAQTFQASISAPATGDAVQGVVVVSGNTDVAGFRSYELSFALANQAVQTWFVIARGNRPVNNDVLGEWDTTTLTDGTYSLRLTVEREDAEPETVLVENIRVRNYTPVETNTPAPTATTDPGEPPTPTVTPLPPTPTALGDNPAELAPDSISNSAKLGAIGAVVLLGVLGLYTAARNRRR